MIVNLSIDLRDTNDPVKKAVAEKEASRSILTFYVRARL